MVSSRLLDAAIDQFGRLGFDGTSTREIARASNTTMSSITYHFGGKLGLYLAAADRIVEAMAEWQRPTMESIARRTTETPADAIDACVDYMDGFAAMMLSAESAPWSRFIIREQFEPTEAFEHIWNGLMQDTLSALLRLTQVARPDLGEGQRKASVILMLGQAISLRASRTSMCRVLNVEALGPQQTGLLRDQLAQNVRAILAQPC